MEPDANQRGINSNDRARSTFCGIPTSVPSMVTPLIMALFPEKAENRSMKELNRLIDHSFWANRKWVEFVYSQKDNDSHPCKLLGHLMVGERIWFERIDGKQKTTEMFPLLTREELVAGFEENLQIYKKLVDGHLDTVIDFKRGSGEEYHARVIDILHHLLTHGYHHRGQLATHYARKGVSYPNTDHINFLIENRL